MAKVGRSGMPRHRGALVVALVWGAVAGCGGLQEVGEAGQALEDAGYEVHELRVTDGEVVADLEPSAQPVEDRHLDEAAQVIWDEAGGSFDQLEVRVRDTEGPDLVETYTETDLRRQFGEPGS